MSFKIDKVDTLAADGTIRPENVQPIASAQRSAGTTAEALPLPPALENVPRSPELDSLLSMANLRADAAMVGLSLAEVVESCRNAANLNTRNKCELLANNSLSILKKQQETLKLAQQKFDEAKALGGVGKILSALGTGIMLIVSLSLIASGVGAPWGAVLFTMTALSVVDVAMKVVSDKGIGGRVAEACGASKTIAGLCDIGVGFALTLPAAIIAPALEIAQMINMGAGMINFGGGVINFVANRESADAVDLTGTSKSCEANLQQLNDMQLQVTDNLIKVNDRANEMLTSLTRAISDANDAFARVRFAS